MQFSRSLLAVAFIGALISQATVAIPSANLDTLKRAVVGGSLLYAVKALKDRKVAAAPNKALHTQGLDIAAQTVQWVDNNKLALVAGLVGYTLIANLIPTPTQASKVN
jgi:hypothetical protein